MLPDDVIINPLVERTGVQCLLITDSNLLSLRTVNLWIDSLYVRLRPPSNAAALQHVLGLIVLEGTDDASQPQLWMTNITLQGGRELTSEADGGEHCGINALATGYPKVYAEGACAPMCDTCLCSGAFPVTSYSGVNTRCYRLIRV